MRPILDALTELRDRPQSERVELYNTLTRAAAEHLLHDLPADPATRPQLLLADRIHANDYNPNKMASVELDLLEESMRDDGITMNVVVAPSEHIRGDHEVVDGFHRRLAATTRLARNYIPCSVVDKPRGGRMASTVRHNRARGKHQVELMGELVRAMIDLGWDDERIADSMGMSPEELLRLKQIVGAAKLIAGVEYSSTYGRDDEPPDLLGE